MSQEKAQLIAPLGVMAVEGMNASGVITATSLDGNIVGMMMWNGEESSFTAYSDADLTGAEFVWSIWNADEANAGSRNARS